MQTQRRFNALTPDEQTTALAAYDAAGAKAIAAGADAGRVADTLRRPTADLALNAEGAVVMLVETTLHDYDPRAAENWGWRSTPAWIEAGNDPMAAEVGGAQSETAAIVAWRCQTETREMELDEAIALLSSDASPARRLAAHRAALTALRDDWRARVEAEVKMRRDREEKDRQWNLENEMRLAVWNALPREAQEYHELADKLPAHAELLTALADLHEKYRDPRRGVPLPPSFRPELLRTPGTARGAPNPRVLAAAGLKISEAP